jgi:hypothetical protein
MNSKSMIRTFVFAGVAILSTILAIGSNYLTRPVRIDGEGDFGRDFNPDFTDAGKATSIRVVAWDEATATAKRFAVEYKDGWKIPTFHDYPADGKDQLAKAASSVIGLKRGSLASRYKTDHERLGVIDPLDEENPSTKGRGTRITLLDQDLPLADFIVGNKVEGSEDKRYLRKFGEDKVYKVAARFDVSTKFADWAETDLLKASGSDITRLRASRPKINAQDEYDGDETVELTREKFGDPWKLATLDEATEELKTSDIDTMVNTLDDLRLVGVRPRPAFQGKPILNADLKVNLPKELRSNPQFLADVKRVLVRDLGEKGFRIGQDAEGETQIVSTEGDLSAGTRDGVLYRLTFGGVFSGTEEEIEIGSTADEKSDDTDKKKSTKKGRPEDQKKSRYLIVRVSFDEKLLPPPPVEPTKPTPPPGVEPLGDAKEDADTKKKEDDDKSGEDPKKGEKKPEPKSDGEKDSDKPADSKKDADEAAAAKGEDTVAAKQEEKKGETEKDDSKKPADEKKDDKKKEDAPADKPKADSDDAKKDDVKKDDAKPAEPKKDLKAEYFEAIKRYDAEKGRFVGETHAFEAKVAAGKQKVQELNDRFADWYYVISNDSFDKLRLTRDALVKPKEKKAGEKIDGENKDENNDAKPATKDEKSSEKKDAEKTPTEKPDGNDAAKSAAKEEKSPEKKADEQKEPEKKEAEKPAEDK